MGIRRQTLIDARKQMFMTQEDVAKYLGVSHHVIGFIERGVYGPRSEYQEALEKLFSIPSHELFKLFDSKVKRTQKGNNYEIRGDITVIYLKRKDKVIMETQIDTTDLPRALEITTWGTSYDSTIDSYYVRGRILTGKGKGTRVKLHRWLYPDIKETEEVDHIFHDTLDNRRSCSLRRITQAQNSQNRKGVQCNNKSGVRGVMQVRERWRVAISVKGKQKHIGYYSSLAEAENAVIEAKKKYHPFSQEALAN